MSVTTITSVAAINNSNSASIAAHSAARHQVCKALDISFVNQGASAAEKKQFASCVENLYPNEMTHSDVMFAKGCVGVFLVLWIIIALTLKFKHKEHLFPSILIGLGLTFVGLFVVGIFISIVSFLVIA